MSLSTPIVQRARSLFFEAGEDPTGLVDNAILESWRRCAGFRRNTAERIGFNIRDRMLLEDLQDRHATLIQDFDSTLGAFSTVLHRSGFHPVLTDANAITIARACDPRHASGDLFHALQLGSDMSESAIGTAAMNCALVSQRAVQVLGDEHYFDANSLFYCAAAPIFGIDGRLVGAVNLTKHQHGPEFGALSFVESCAAAIEQRQLERLLACLTVRMSWTANGQSRTATVAFGVDGELLGMTREAGQLLNPRGQPLSWLTFERLFDGRFGPWLKQLADTARPQPIRLHSGAFVFIEALDAVAPRAYTLDAAPTAPLMGDGQFPAQFQLALKALGKDLSVLVRGETGTGKEVVARSLHERHCRNRPFVAINCAALPEHLIEAELFGYVEGAFTGARRGGASGRIEEADGGVLFLDEIGDMPIALQARLLRVLDTREVTRVGSGKARKVKFSLVCATHQNLESLIEKDLFRADLFYRIAGITLTLRPLRQRTQQASLFRSLLSTACGHQGGISAEALDLLTRHSWPGNTREVISVLKRATLMCDAHQVLSAECVRFALTPADDRRKACATQTNQQPVPLADLEEQGITQALYRTQGNVSLAAEQLGISRSTLQRRIRATPQLLRVRDEQRR
ncbi:sigma-54-dependent Fis family transcriptional regulator [Pseudomonas typographi]|uniref:Sigma-54-dependent Fis family transcriptional regulator n=1 Tax=Pseudomonas typographi TaxID=2715964 RepID=A0ABR7Z552_9PSED|nr:sigma 54-interacting transcriptional regulator [Pseudomonas typographi]MBD1600600.1 sigma-54-dependent Fis family transcriptional regulator [Pseudomonas typographi]